MKRQKKKPIKKKPDAPTQVAPVSMSPSRRNFLVKLRNRGFAAVVIGGGGWLFARDVQATLKESDVSRIGNGIPAVVQIHDPQCQMCIELQKETRRALKEIAAEDLQFVVANIQGENGRKLANKHGVAHVTLLLFDGEGNRRDILRGQNTSDVLERRFRQFLSQLNSG